MKNNQYLIPGNDANLIACGFRGVCRSLHRDQTIGVLHFQKLGKTERWDFYHFDRLVIQNQGTGFVDQATGNQNSDSKGEAKEDSCVIQTTKSQKKTSIMEAKEEITGCNFKACASQQIHTWTNTSGNTITGWTSAPTTSTSKYPNKFDGTNYKERTRGFVPKVWRGEGWFVPAAAKEAGKESKGDVEEGAAGE